MKPEQERLVERLHAALAQEPSLREVSMFGGRSFMVDGRLVVGARKDGSLLVHIPVERYAELIERPGASPAEMGRGRTMSRAWVSVAAGFIGSDDQLSAWLDCALEHDAETHGES